MDKYTKQKQTKANKTKQNKKLKRSSTLRIKMANITEKFTVKTFDGADTWTLPPTFTDAQVVLEKKNFFAMAPGEGVKDICFIKNELKAAFYVQHVDARALAKACSENLMFKLNRTGLVVEDDGEPNSRMKLLELTSSQEYIDSDVNYGHVQDLLGVDTTKPFEWNSKRSVGLFATVRRVFFGTLPNDSQPEADYFGPPFMGDFGNPPENILNTNSISGQMSDKLYLQSKYIHALHTWRMDYIQRVDHLLSFVLTDKLRTGYFNWHKQQYEKAEAKKAEEKAKAEAARKKAEEEAEAARIAKEKEEEAARKQKEKEEEAERQEVHQTINGMGGWKPEQIALFMSLLSKKAKMTAEVVVNANANGASSSSSSNNEPSEIEKRHANLDKALKEEEAKRIAKEKEEAVRVAAEEKEEEASDNGTTTTTNTNKATGATNKAAAINQINHDETNKAAVIKQLNVCLKNRGMAPYIPTGGSSSSENAGTTTTTKTKPVEKKEDKFTNEQIKKIFEWWHGDGEENKGLRGLIAAKVHEISEGEDEPEYFNLEGVKTLDKSVWMEWYVKFNIVTHPYDLFHNHTGMMDQIQDKCGLACRWACEGFSPERDDFTTAEYNALEKKICKETGKTYVEATDDYHGEEEDDEEEEEEDEGENNGMSSSSSSEDEEKKDDVVDLTVTIASKINDLDDDDTLKKYLETPGGKAACVFGYRNQMGESNTDNIFKKVRSTKNKKIDFKDIADLELTEEFITTYVIEFARHVHEYESDRTYALGSLVMLTPKAFDTLDGAQRRALPVKAGTLWRVTNYNTDGTYEIVAEYNTIEKIDADEEDLRKPIVYSTAGKHARKRARKSDGASSSTGKSSPQKKTKRKRTQAEIPNVTRDDVNLNTSRLQKKTKKPKTPTQTGFRT